MRLFDSAPLTQWCNARLALSRKILNGLARL
jgi:hypothetical protein